MEDGIRVSYSGTWAGRGAATTWDGDWQIQGDRGVLTLTDGELAHHPHTGSDDSDGSSQSGAKAVPVITPEPTLGDLQTSLLSFLKAIERADEPETGIRDNVHSIGMVFAAERSIREGRPVAVEG